jgi:hypothetical protein
MKKVLFLGLNNNQLPYINILKEQLGYYVVGTDLNEKAVGRTKVDVFYPCGYNEYEKLVQIGIKEGFSNSDKVFTASSQFAHLGASYFANHFDIDYPRFDDIKLCLDKSLYYAFFQKNNIPLPKTWILKTQDELEDILSNQPQNNSFYLKSDNSKNPKYVYRFLNKDLKDLNINWKKDRYFQEYYILQEEFYGEHIRLNIFGDKCLVYHFEIERLKYDKSYQIELIKKAKVLESLQQFLQKINMQNWLLKFDIVVNKDFEFVVLDIGMDPPYRMLNDYKIRQQNFEKNYIEMYLLHKNNFEIYDWKAK